MQNRTLSIFSIGAIIVCGIGLPALTLGVELTTHMCGSHIFDPIPTFIHVLLVGLVPLTNAATLHALCKNNSAHQPRLMAANALIIGISLFYTILFIPLLPISLLAVMYMGMGLLPLAPLLSLSAALLGRRHLKRLSAHKPAGYAHMGCGLAAAFIVLVGLAAPHTLTRLAMQLSAAPTQGTSPLAIQYLRRLGDEETMLRLCYLRSGRTADMVSFLFALNDPVTPRQARTLYYRVKGKPFNSVPPPVLPGNTQFHWLQFDEAQGGETVAGQVDKLNLAWSRLDGSLDANAALAYLEWTLIFKNDSRRPQEARTQILLPPDGVVSRLTLWVNGEAREAAFARTGQVRQAYSRVVSRQRDPVLVTAQGPDRVLVQCFPVQPQSEMKIRLGITAPLVLPTQGQGQLFLPAILERNFGLSPSITHTVWLESSQPLAHDSGLQAEQNVSNVHTLRGSLPMEALSSLSGVITCRRDTARRSAWSRYPGDGGSAVIRQSIQAVSARQPTRVIMVVDGSASLASARGWVGQALNHWPADIPMALLLAADGVHQLLPLGPMTANRREQVTTHLVRHPFEGGHDNVPALAQAWDMATRQGGGATILWLHGPQPVEMQSPEALLQRWDRRPGAVTLMDLQIGTGPNRVAEAFLGRPSYRVLRTNRMPEGTLMEVFQSWANRAPQYEVRRKMVAGDLFPDPHQDLPAQEKTSDHLARLWAYETIKSLCATQRPADRDQAVELAVQHQLVTPVSGAVVLETDQQYADADLQPAPPAEVPTIPEPEMIVLVLMGLILMTWQLRIRRNSCRNH